MVILAHLHFKILHKQRLEVIKHNFCFIPARKHIFKNESIETHKRLKKTQVIPCNYVHFSSYKVSTDTTIIIKD